MKDSAELDKEIKELEDLLQQELAEINDLKVKIGKKLETKLDPAEKQM
jgi:hypothetical protein